ERPLLNPKNKNYNDYGGRGIAFYPPWINDYPAFRNYVNQHLGPKPSPSHTIDRTNNNGNYEPGNLRWATKSEQVQNRRFKPDKTLTALILEYLDKQSQSPAHQPEKKIVA